LELIEFINDTPLSEKHQGNLIVPWIEIIKFLVRKPNLVFQIPADKSEEIVAGGYKAAGFDEVILTPRSGDLGRDVIATKKGIGQIRVIEQVIA